MKASYSGRVIQNVCERDKTHSLVVGHECANDHRVLSLGQAFGREIDRFVIPVWAKCALLLQPPQIFHHGVGDDEGGQHGRVRRHNKFFYQTTFQTETWNSEWSILIVEMEISHVVSRFCNAPRHAALFAVLDLALDDSSLGFVKQRVWVIAYFQ